MELEDPRLTLIAHARQFYLQGWMVLYSGCCILNFPQQMSNQTIRVVARIVAFPEKVEEAKALLLDLIEPSLKDAGCIKYELWQNRAEPTNFTFVEEWASDADLDAHLASPHVAAAIARIPELIAEGPDIQRYNLLN